MKKYTQEELLLCVGQECSLEYMGTTFTGTIVRVFGHSNDEFVTIKTINEHTKEPFWTRRVTSVPVLDKVRSKRLWNLIK